MEDRGSSESAKEDSGDILKMGKTINELLKKFENHKVTISFTPHEETQLRETTGILKESNAETIHIQIHNEFGEVNEYYMNRHACTLHSITDEGKAEASAR